MKAKMVALLDVLGSSLMLAAGVCVIAALFAAMFVGAYAWAGALILAGVVLGYAGYKITIHADNLEFPVKAS